MKNFPSHFISGPPKHRFQDGIRSESDLLRTMPVQVKGRGSSRQCCNADLIPVNGEGESEPQTMAQL